MVKKLTWKDKGNCLNEASLPGMSLRTDLGSGVFFITLPRLSRYSSPNWESPSFGTKVLLDYCLDYNVNANVRAPSDGKQKQQITAKWYGRGANLGVWRFRADWQASYEHTTGVLHKHRKITGIGINSIFIER